MLVTLFFGRRRRWRQAQLPALAQLSPPPAAQAWRRLRRHRPAMISLALLVLLALLCLIGPSLSPWRDDAGDVLNINQAPSGAHWLGTDFSAAISAPGCRWRADIADHRPGVDAAVGNAGLCAGGARRLSGGVADRLIMRFADLLMTIPGLPLLIIMGAMLTELDVSPDYRIYMVMIMLSLLGWPSLARLVRGQILSLRERDFMLATEVLGLSTRRRLFGHLLPNTVPILVVVATMAVANAILSESALSYLGLGVVPPTPSWGNMMDAANSLIDFQRRPWLWMPPGLAIFVTVVAINILGDGLRDALDPKMNGVTR